MEAMRVSAGNSGGDDVGEVLHGRAHLGDRALALGGEAVGDRGVLLDDVPAAVAGSLEGLDDTEDVDVALAQRGEQAGLRGGQLWSWRYLSPFCQWFQVVVSDDQRVREVGYGVDPQCDVDL